MTKRMRELLTDQVLQHCAARYDLQRTDLIPLGAGVENVIYQFERGGKAYVLRITPSSHRSLEMTEAEIDWISYLAEGGASVPKPFPSTNNLLVEKVELPESYLLLSAYEKAPGHGVQEKDWNKQLFYHWGKTQGRIHRLTKSYQPRTGNKRYVWYEEDFISGAADYLPQDHDKVLDKYEAVISRIKQLPQNTDTYGLTHADFHSTNLYVHNGSITVFDFDDCCYHYLVNDIAVALFSAVKKSWSGNDKKQFTHFFMTHYLQGYREEYNIDSSWLELIPDFLKLRELVFYTVIYRSYDLNNLDPSTGEFMENRKELIEQDVPYMNLTKENFKL